MTGCFVKLVSILWLAFLISATIDIKEVSCEERIQNKNDPITNKEEIPEKKSTYRLPTTVIPLNYDIKLSEINFETNTFKGNVKIFAQIIEKTNEIAFHVGNTMNVSQTSVNIEDLSSLDIIENSHNTTSEIWTITLKEKVPAPTGITINVIYTGRLRSDMIGFYKSSYIDEIGKEIWLAGTQFGAIHARHAFPCFDEPAYKSKFTISILPPKDYDCLSNMPNKIIEGTWHKFEESVPMSTYLVAFIVSNFKSRSKGNFTVWSRPNAVNQLEYSLDIGSKVLDYYGKQFDSPYQLKKMDMVAMPDFEAGAMENWGLITYRETAMLYDKDDPSAIAKQRVATVVVHECAHQWLGNLVTHDWWSYLWLTEGFARYYQYMATDKIEASWKMDQQFVVDQHQTALGDDALADSKPMTRSITTTEEIGSVGGVIIYNKGASILRMIEKTIGSSLFDTAVVKYLNARKYKTATPSDLWQAFQTQIDAANIKITIDTVMKSWTEKAGYPCVSVTINPNVITLSQERFFIQKPNPVPENQLWSIPISLLTSTQANSGTSPSTKPVHWLSSRNANFTVENKDANWTILNVESAGYYRVNYDKDSWNKIIEALTNGDFEKIPVLNRAAIVDDLMNLARAGLLDYDTALRGIQYLKRETNYLPFKSAFTALDYLLRIFSISEDADTFKTFVISLFEDIYHKLTYDDKPDDDQLTILLRHEINERACNLHYTQCIEKSKTYFSKWMKENVPVPKNQRSAAYCTAIKYGSNVEWNFLWNQYQTANLAAEQVTILKALGCSTNTTISEKYLLTALTGFSSSLIRKQDISTVFSGIYSASFSGADFVIDFVIKEYDTLLKYYNGTNDIESLISNALQSYPAKALVDKVEKFLVNDNRLATIKESLEKTINKVKLEFKWFEIKLPIITNWILAKKENTVNYRLPDNVIPKHYTVKLTPFLIPGNFTFNGIVNIMAEVTKSTNKIVLHSDQINIKEVKVIQLKADSREELTVLNYTSTEKYHFLNIILKADVQANTKLSIEIKYTGILNSEMKGFYRSSYRISNETRWLAATHLEPVGARRVFPCFDEPALKAIFDISVDVPENYDCISNMELKSKKGELYEFHTTPLMSTYLMAVVVSDFKSKEQKDSGRTYKVWSNPIVINQVNYSLEVMQPIIEFYETNFGHKYTLPKMDMVALPDFSSGAMENWGLITYRESQMLYDPLAMSSLVSKQGIRNVIAHEIAHQWFGNLVSPLWWDYLWLSEGFARYFQHHAHTKQEDSWKLETQFVVDYMHTAMADDSSKSTHSVTAKVFSPSEIRDIFDSISYGKAGSLIRMIEKLIGRDKFYGALHRYLDSCKYSTGTPEALFEAFQNEFTSTDATAFNVSKVMNSWTRQPGFPVINVTFKDGKADLTQNRFFLRTNKTCDDTWIVPITWATRSNPNFEDMSQVQWFEGNSTTINIKRNNSDWVILNLQQTGFYRVNYDESMWYRIIAALNSPERTLIHEVNRAYLVDDILNLGRSGFLDYDTVFAGLNYLTEETDYAPWNAALRGFSYLSKQFAGRTDDFALFKLYTLDLLESSYKRLGFREVQGESHVDTLFRRLVLTWLCKLDHEDCVNQSLALFEKQRTNSSYRVPSNQRYFIYCVAIKKGEAKAWNYLWNELLITDYATEQTTILSALGCSQNSANLTTLLDLAVTPNSVIRLQDTKKAFTNVLQGGLVGVETTLDFIDANYEKIRNHTNDDSVIKSAINTISKLISDGKLLKKFNTFLENFKEKMPSLLKTLLNAQKRANIELDWYNNQAPKIRNWLTKNNPKAQQRLSTSVVPESYDIYLKPYFEEKNFTFDGDVTIIVKINEDTSIISLHAKYLNIAQIKVNDQVTENFYYTLKPKLERLNIVFANKLTAGTKLKLNIIYSGHLKDDMRGFYRSYYYDDNGKKVWLATTQFEPTYARRAFPGFDEPRFKAKFTVHIAKPKGYRTLSNMGSQPSERKDSDGLLWDDYDESLTMSPYIVAFAVTNFDKYSGSLQPSRVSVWARSQLKNYVNNTPNIGNQALNFLEKFTNISYPLKEMNFLAVPDFDMGAMENWGLVTFREYGLTYDQTSISANYKKYVTAVVSHELVHMWFGNLVTCEWWDYTWLNEGFAEYLAHVVSDSIEPSWKLLKQFVVDDLHDALDFDSKSSSHPMNNKVLTPTEAQDGFDKITYDKSASILRMLHHSFDQRLFVEALHNYLDKHKYSTARPEYLTQEIKVRLEKEGVKVPGNLEVDVTTVIESWITQSGYPVVNASRYGDNVTLSQQQFLVSPFNSSEKNRFYWVPITYTTETELNFNTTTPRLWLGYKQQTIVLKPEDSWFLLNIQEIGFYRVNYDTETWRRLIELLNSNQLNKIDEVNRAQLIDDSFNLARAGYLDYEIALNVSKYLPKESSYFPWKAYFSAISYLLQRFEGHEESRKLVADYLLNLIVPIYEKLGFEENMKKDEHLLQLHRQLIITWACTYDYEKCVNQAKTSYAQKSISPNIASTVYCTTIRYGSVEIWNDLWYKFTKAVLATDSITILRGLGCSRNTTILEKYLDSIIDQDSMIRRQDAASAFSSIYTSSQIGLDTTIEYLKNNLQRLYEYYGDWSEVGSLFKSISGRITTMEQINNLEAFAKEERASKVKSSVEKAIKTAKNNYEWFNKNSNKINEWLKVYGKSSDEQSSSSTISSTPSIFSLTFVSLVLFWGYY